MMRPPAGERYRRQASSWLSAGRTAGVSRRWQTAGPAKARLAAALPLAYATLAVLRHVEAQREQARPRPPPHPAGRDTRMSDSYEQVLAESQAKPAADGRMHPSGLAAARANGTWTALGDVELPIGSPAPSVSRHAS
jgi:hypothetical protein